MATNLACQSFVCGNRNGFYAVFRYDTGEGVIIKINACAANTAGVITYNVSDGTKLERRQLQRFTIRGRCYHTTAERTARIQLATLRELNVPEPTTYQSGQSG
ncbi:MAG: hypothetical protein ACLR13_04050 [Acutalibacteraceae bacterium]